MVCREKFAAKSIVRVSRSKMLDTFFAIGLPTANEIIPISNSAWKIAAEIYRCPPRKIHPRRRTLTCKTATELALVVAGQGGAKGDNFFEPAASRGTHRIISFVSHRKRNEFSFSRLIRVPVFNGG